MPSNQTPNYQLSQWERSDKVQMEDFNADNAKIDAVLGTLAAQVSTKAEQSALATLTGKVAKLGNCQIYYFSYTGNGEADRSFTFPHKPLLIIGMSESYIFRAVQGAPYTMCRTNGFQGAYNCPTTWSGNTISWQYASSSEGPNANRSKFYAVALLDAGD